MNYTYRYPTRIQNLSGRRYGHIDIPEDYLGQTHTELLNRLDVPEKTIAVQIEVDAPRERVWELAASTVETFFSHHPINAGISDLNILGSHEGGRFVVHRSANGAIFDRIGEVLVNMPAVQMTVSDIEIADPSVVGFFPSLYTIRLEDHPEDPERTVVYLAYTMLGVAHPWAIGVLAYQANSIKYHSERQSA